MPNINWVWLIWALMFVPLETAGLMGWFGMRPLTHHIRSLIEEGWGWAFAMLFGWLVFHFFIEPFWSLMREGGG